MFRSLSLLIVAALTAARVHAAGDVSVVGSGMMSLTPLGPITPDISVVGEHTTSAVATDTPDVSVVGAWTTTASAEAAAATTQTECYQVFQTDGVTSSVPAQATVTDGTNPPGYQCFLIYSTGGGLLHLPLPSASSPSSSQDNQVITVGLPVIVSVVGLAAIIGAGFVFMRIRARRAAESQRTWVDRPGGWVRDSAAGKMESGAAQY